MHSSSGYVTFAAVVSTCLVSVRKVCFNMLKTDEFSYKNFTLWHINMKKRGKNGKKYSTCVHSVYTWSCHHLFCPFLSIFRFSFFGQSDQKRKKNQLSCLFIFCLKNSQFAWKWQLIFLLFGHFHPKTKNGMNSTLKVKSWKFYYSRGIFANHKPFF